MDLRGKNIEGGYFNLVTVEGDSNETSGKLQDGQGTDLGNIAVGGLSFNSATSEFTIPVGTTAERPASPSAGYMRFNTDFSKVEVYDGSRFRQIDYFSNELALGVAQATVTANDAVFDTPPLEVEYLVIAGGGGGGTGNNGGGGGGGGAGGYLESTSELEVSTSYSITVGAGGASPTLDDEKNDGSNSIAFGKTALGGGGAAGRASGNDGGSGGGAGRENNSSTGGTGLQPTSTDGGFGNNGGDVDGDGSGNPSSLNIDAGSGGGGAGSAGSVNTSNSTGGDGGAGKASSITGSSVFYAGGGGGGGADGSSASSGGAGGGGNGGFSSSRNGVSGTANTGGGGGGCDAGGPSSGVSVVGGSGGSGVVILRYPSAYSISVGAGLTSSTSTVGEFKVTTVTAGSDTVSFATS